MIWAQPLGGWTHSPREARDAPQRARLPSQLPTVKAPWQEHGSIARRNRTQMTQIRPKLAWADFRRLRWGWGRSMLPALRRGAGGGATCAIGLCDD